MPHDDRAPWPPLEWRAAVRQERRDPNPTQSLQLRVAAVEATPGGRTCLTLGAHRPGSDLARLDLDLVGQPISCPNQWQARVAVVEPDERRVTLERHDGAPPAVGQRVTILLPDYLGALAEWLDLCAASLPDDLGEHLKCALAEEPPFPSSPPAHPGARPAQLAALAAGERPLSLVWGPPGTGKTWTLGALVAAQAAAGRRILAVSTTNSAVDQLTLAVDDAWPAHAGHPPAEGAVLRARSPVLDALLVPERSHLLAWHGLDQAHSAEQRSLLARERQLTQALAREGWPEPSDVHDELAQVRHRLRTHQELYSEQVRDLVESATVVLCSVTQLCWTAAIHGSTFDTIVIDEASMVPVAAALRSWFVPGRQRVVVGGDFRQLAPIARSQDSNARRWFGNSLFELLGAERRPRRAQLRASERLTLLDQQSRMPQGLGDIVSRTFYDGDLRSLRGPGDLVPTPGWPDAPILLVEPAAGDALSPLLQPRSRFQQGYSRSSEPRARVAVALALEALQQGRTVAVLTPFRDQARLVERSLGPQVGPGLVVGTVHRMQGQEADVVIYDPCAPSSPWLRSSDDAPRLHNVAISRTRHQLVVIGTPAELRANPWLAELVDEALPWTPAWTARPLRGWR